MRSRRSTRPFRADRNRVACRCCSWILMVRRRFFSAVSNHETRGYPSRRAQERAPQDEAKDRCGEPPRAITHIGCLFSDLVVAGQLSFLEASPDSIISAEFSIDPATRRSKAGQRPIAVTREEIS